MEEETIYKKNKLIKLWTLTLEEQIKDDGTYWLVFTYEIFTQWGLV